MGALMQGMEAMSKLNIDTFQGFGDFKLVIQTMKNIQSGKGKEVGKVQKRILTFSWTFRKFIFSYKTSEQKKCG